MTVSFNYTWAAVLRDGRSIYETDDPAPRFRDVAADVTDLHLLPLVEGWPIYRLSLNPNQRAIWCRRHHKRMNIKTGVEEHSVLHIIGFQYTAPDGHNYQSLTYVPDNGSPVMYGPGPFGKDHGVYGWVPVGD